MSSSRIGLIVAARHHARAISSALDEIQRASLSIGGPTLAQLILDTKLDRTYEQLGKAAGGVPTDKRLQQIAGGARLKNFPDPDSINGIAAATGAPVLEVVLAAARSLGLDVDGPIVMGTGAFVECPLPTATASAS